MEQSRRWFLGSIGAGATGLALAACGTASDTSQASGSPSASAASGAPTSSLSEDELVPLRLFASSMLNDNALFALGGTAAHTAEVGEIIRICQSINKRSGNPKQASTETFDDYLAEFGSYGTGLATQAEGSQGVTARSRWLRAATCAGQQLFFVLGGSDGGQEQSLFQSTDARWHAALREFTPSVIEFNVASPFGSLPGYFLRPDTSRRAKPTVIISEGSDGQNVETMQFGVAAALARGYNVVLFEGPGQMSLLFERQVPFTPNWNEVIAPVLRWAKRREDVGRIGLVGISFAGMLCASAGAKLKGLDALVLEPGAWSFPKLWGDQETLKQVQAVENAPEEEQKKAREEINAGFEKAWPSMTREQQFVIYKRGEIMLKSVQDDARANRPVSDYYGLLRAMLPFVYDKDLAQITIPTMVTSNAGDEFFGEQSQEAFDMLTKVPDADKQYVSFTPEQGTQLHDQPLGTQPAQEVVFDWLSQYLG